MKRAHFLAAGLAFALTAGYRLSDPPAFEVRRGERARRSMRRRAKTSSCA